MRFFKKKARSQSGIATAAVIALSAVLTIIAFFILEASRGHHQGNVEGLLYFNSVDIIKANLYSFSANNVAWNHTKAHASNSATFNCVNAGTICSTAGGRVVIISPNNAIYYNFLTAGHGFKLDGTMCTTYEASNKLNNQGCVVKPEVWWKPFCASNCFIPPEKGFLYFRLSTPSQDGYLFKGVNIFGLPKP